MKQGVIDFYKKLASDYKRLSAMNTSSHYTVNICDSKFCDKIEAVKLLKAMYVATRHILYELGYTKDEIDKLETKEKFYYVTTEDETTGLREMFAFLTERREKVVHNACRSTTRGI